MTREEFIKKLHPAITHVRASDEMSEETLDAINEMVDKVFTMSSAEIKELSLNANKFRAFEAAVAKESKNYPLLKNCNGRFNREAMKEFYKRGFSPVAACNALITEG